MQNEISAEQKETARAYLRRAFSARAGHWFTMEEIKGMAPTAHGIRTLCSRGDEAVKDGELINRFRDGKNYKEWSWHVRKADEFFFYKLQGQFSPLHSDFSALRLHVKKLLYKPQDQIELYRGSHEAPVLMETVRLSPQDLIARGYAICSNCHGAGSESGAHPGDLHSDACLFCEGTGWSKGGAQ
ncbi:MAG: hypothetical protein AB7V08_08720 [Elusimicrobiales bacterium]